MRKYLRYANVFVLAAGGVGMAMMAWLYAAGTDERGLYPAKHPAWILVGILTVVVAVVVWLLVRQAGTNRNYRQNFAPSILAALGCAAGATGLLLGGLTYIGMDKPLTMLTGFVGILGGLALLPAIVGQLRGQRSKLPAHILPCFFFALQLFVLGQEFGAEPEMCRYLYRFWASASMVPACYWLWSFDVNLGKRTDCLFWCLVAGYCNLVAAAGNEQWLLHIGMAIWMLTALPRLQYLPKAQRPTSEPVPVSAPVVEPAPTLEPVHTAEQPPQEESLSTTDPLAVELPDANAILEELLRDFGQQENP